jgi:thiol:disulfide interchange protein
MPRAASLCLLVVSLVLAFVFWHKRDAASDAVPADALSIALPDHYDDQRDPAKDLLVAAAQARNSHRNIFVEVGGNWCSWCHRLDAFFLEHPDLAALRDKNYVAMKVNMSQENPNRAFLSRLPYIHGYPHIFIFDANGKLIHSQPTNELEEGSSYNPEHFQAFLERFAPQSH